MAGVIPGGGHVEPAEVAGRVAAVRARLREAGGADVRVVAAIKDADAALVDAAVDAGVPDIGASYAQALLAVAGQVRSRPRWHFIGRLQTNKVRSLAGLVDLWQSVDRARLADEIARWAPSAHILVQVDVTGDPAKGGCPEAAVPGLVAHAAAAGLVVEGLMAGPTTLRAGRAPFRRVRLLADELGLPERCMGMTDDLEDAVAEGATMVRVGRALFAHTG